MVYLWERRNETLAPTTRTTAIHESRLSDIALCSVKISKANHNINYLYNTFEIRLSKHHQPVEVIIK